MLSIQNVSIGYGTRPDILKNISFEVKASEILALIGPNGSGKTTLMRGITGLLPLRTGSIHFQTRDLSILSPRERAKLISVVPQAAALPPGYTVYETVAHGRTPYLNWYGKLSSDDKTIIEQAIQITGLKSLAEKEVSSLSGGEQQRVILARALTQNAPVMILDEPTNSLDLHYQVSLLQLEREICQKNKLTIIVILHDLNLAARFADRIAILHNGQIVKCGTPAKVLHEDLLSEIYKTPIRILNDPREGLIVLPVTKR